MRTRTGVIAALAVLICAPMVANAVVVDGKDWRQLTDTVNFTWNETNSVCGSGLCSGGVGDLATLNDWYWADYDELSGLLLGLAGGSWTGCVEGDCFFVGRTADIDWAVTQFDSTSTDPALYAVQGWARTNFFVGALATGDPDDLAVIYHCAGCDRHQSVGVWLFRPVPEPGTLALLGLGLAGLGLSRRRRAN